MTYKEIIDNKRQEFLNLKADINIEKLPAFTKEQINDSLAEIQYALSHIEGILRSYNLHLK